MSVDLYTEDDLKAVELKWWTFPGGERGVKILNVEELDGYQNFFIRCFFRSNEDLIDVLMLNDAIKSTVIDSTVSLMIPYFPYARQDRVMTDGEGLSLRVAAKMINQCNFKWVEVWDAHSDVLAAFFPEGVLHAIPQHELVIDHPDFRADSVDAILSPDAGASKKIYKLAKKLNVPVIECGKKRNVVTGEIIGTTIGNLPDDHQNLKNIWVFDDICDGGATFLNLAKAFKEAYPDKEYTLNLFVTHGIFSKGLTILSDYYSKVLAVVDLRKETSNV